MSEYFFHFCVQVPQNCSLFEYSTRVNVPVDTGALDADVLPYYILNPLIYLCMFDSSYCRRVEAEERRHVTSPAVRASKDGDHRDAASPPHLCASGRFSRLVKLIKRGELRWTGTAYSVDKRRVRNVDFSLFIFFLSQRRLHGRTTLLFPVS